MAPPSGLRFSLTLSTKDGAINTTAALARLEDPRRLRRLRRLQDQTHIIKSRCNKKGVGGAIGDAAGETKDDRLKTKVEGLKRRDVFLEDNGLGLVSQGPPGPGPSGRESGWVWRHTIGTRRDLLQDGGRLFAGQKSLAVRVWLLKQAFTDLVLLALARWFLLSSLPTRSHASVHLDLVMVP